MIENTQTIVIDDDTQIEATFQMNVVSGDHDMLDHRDLPDQHPTSAITGLDDTLSGISSSLDGKLDKVSTANQVYGTDENGDQTTYNADSFGQVDDVQVGGVSVVTNKIAELGTMAGETTSDYYTKTEADNEFATAAQGALADTAIQPLDNITELTNNAGYITASSVKDGTLTIQKNGTQVSTFSANQEGDSTANLIIPTTAADVGALPDTTTINDLTSPAQQAALNSGATSTNIAQIATNTGDISTINGKIPSAATTTNQLADKDFVNSSIATNTANFIGTFNSVAELEAYSGTVTNNDYAFVINSVVTDNGNDWADLTSLNAYDKTLLTNFDYAWVVNGSMFDLYRFDIVNQVWELRVQNTNKADVTLNTAYNRYKATVSGSTVTWDFEYTLNNSSFTAAQWAAINSGANDTNIAQITTNQNAIGTLSSLNTSVKTDLVSAINEVEGTTSTALQPNDNISELNNDSGFITGISSSDVTTALGYTPVNPSSLATVATSGSYNDLSNKPTIPTTTNSVTSGSTAALTSGGAYTALQGYANTSLSNLSSDGQMVVDSQNGTISNCILEIPQNLKLELNNGVVTIKSGSIVTITGSTYTTVTLTSDYNIAMQSGFGNNVEGALFYTQDSGFGFIPFTRIHSGATQPTSLSGNTHIWFNTNDKTIYTTTDAGSTWSNQRILSYPIACCNYSSGTINNFLKDSNGNDMIFNGAGFIGHHAFVYPGVRGLTPQGFNNDGTLKSGLNTNTSLAIIEMSQGQYSGYTRTISLIAGNPVNNTASYVEIENRDALINENWVRQYVKNENIIISKTNSGIVEYTGGVYPPQTPLVFYNYNGTTVTDFTIRQPVRTATTEMLRDYATTTAIANMQTTTNLVTSVSSASTDSQYPSAKLLYDTVGNIETLLNNINSGS